MHEKKMVQRTAWWAAGLLMLMVGMLEVAAPRVGPSDDGHPGGHGDGHDRGCPGSCHSHDHQ